MAISDINRAMMLASQPTTFDQNAWKTAFDIANGFTSAEHARTQANDAARAYNENMATSDNRVKYMNWDYGNKQKMGDLNLASEQLKYNNAVALNPSYIDAQKAQNGFLTTSYGQQNADILAAQELNKAIQEQFKKGGDTSLPAILKAYGGNVDPTAFGLMFNTVQQQDAAQQKAQQEIMSNILKNSMTTVTNIEDGTKTTKFDPELFNTLLKAQYGITPEALDRIKRLSSAVTGTNFLTPEQQSSANVQITNELANLGAQAAAAAQAQAQNPTAQPVAKPETQMPQTQPVTQPTTPMAQPVQSQSVQPQTQTTQTQQTAALESQLTPENIAKFEAAKAQYAQWVQQGVFTKEQANLLLEKAYQSYLTKQAYDQQEARMAQATQNYYANGAQQALPNLGSGSLTMKSY